MKIIYKISFIAFIGAAIFSCSKSKVTPVTIGKVDTSKTRINDTQLVGNWAIVSDTISIGNSNVMFHGGSNDYYKFTEYGNLYISETYGLLVDTAIYGIQSGTNQVGWVNIYTRVNGVSTNTTTTTPPFTILNVDSANLVLQQNAQTSQGMRYEKLTFKKMK
jgi:hypothetical protein